MSPNSCDYCGEGFEPGDADGPEDIVRGKYTDVICRRCQPESVKGHVRTDLSGRLAVFFEDKTFIECDVSSRDIPLSSPSQRPRLTHDQFVRISKTTIGPTRHILFLAFVGATAEQRDAMDGDKDDKDDGHSDATASLVCAKMPSFETLSRLLTPGIRRRNDDNRYVIRVEQNDVWAAYIALFLYSPLAGESAVARGQWRKSKLASSLMSTAATESDRTDLGSLIQAETAEGYVTITGSVVIECMQVLNNIIGLAELVCTYHTGPPLSPPLSGAAEQRRRGRSELARATRTIEEANAALETTDRRLADAFEQTATQRIDEFLRMQIRPPTRRVPFYTRVGGKRPMAAVAAAAVSTGSPSTPKRVRRVASASSAAAAAAST